MSSSGPRYHIPFPSNFLSLSSPLKTSASIDGSVGSPTGAPAPVHSFLSNRPAVVPRHSSVSSISSEDSTRSAPPTPANEVTISPILAPQSPAFLPLNSKFAATPRNARPMIGKAHSFLSNQH